MSDRAARLLAACAVSVDADGTVCATLEALGEAAGQKPRTAARAMAELVEGGLVHVDGKTNQTFRYLDERVLKALQRQPAKRTAGQSWRQLRAQAGGRERAMQAAQRARDALKVSLDAALEQLQALRATPSSSTSTTTLAWLKVETTHAVRCFDKDCDRCLTLDRVLDDDADADEVDDVARDAFEAADELRPLALEVVAASKDRGPGSRTRAANAITNLERVL